MRHPLHVAIEQYHTKRIFGVEVVIKRTLVHIRGVKDFVQAPRREAFGADNRPRQVSRVFREETGFGDRERMRQAFFGERRV